MDHYRFSQENRSHSMYLGHIGFKTNQFMWWWVRRWDTEAREMLLKVVGLLPKAGWGDPEGLCLEHRSKWLSNACPEVAAVSNTFAELPELSQSAVVFTDLLGNCCEFFICLHTCLKLILENFFCLSILFPSLLWIPYPGNSNPAHIKEILGDSSQPYEEM